MPNSAKLLLFVLLMSGQTAALAQTIQAFTFGTAGVDEQAVAVRQHANGAIFLGGHTSAGTFGGNDITVSKLGSAGDSVFWTQHFGTSDNDFCQYLNTAGESALILAGASYPISGSGIPNALLIKADTAGNEIFKKIIGQPGTAETFSYVQQTADGGFIACGFVGNTFQGGIGNDAVVMKFDSAGTLQWRQELGGFDNDYAQEVRQTADGGYIVSVDSKSFNTFGFYDCIAYKLDAAGSEEWHTIAGGDPFDTGNQGILLTAAGDYVMFGEAATGTSPGYDITISKVHRNGQLLWNRHWPQIGTEAAFSAMELPNGRILLTGYSNANTNGDSPIDIFLIEADTAGSPVNYTYIGSSGADIAYDVQPSPFGGHLIAGGMQPGNSFDYTLVRYNYTGPLAQPENLPSQTGQIMVFPNPVAAGALLAVSIPHGKAKLTLTNAFGRFCWSQNTEGGQTQVSLPVNLSSGIYFLQAEGENWVGRQKVVIR